MAIGTGSESMLEVQIRAQCVIDRISLFSLATRLGIGPSARTLRLLAQTTKDSVLMYKV